jgi:SAM-dependent methyltransferase
MQLCVQCDSSITGDGWQCPACGYEPETENGILRFTEGPPTTTGGYAPERYAKLFEREAAHFWFRSRRKLILQTIRRHLGETGRYMEIGCGTGHVLAGIAQGWPKCEIWGTDLLGEGLAFAGRRVPAATLAQLDPRRLPFESSFDVIGAFDVLEHIKEDELVLRRTQRALKPGGVLVLTVPQHPFLWSAHDETARHVRRYRRNELRDKLRAGGFLVEEKRSFMALTLPFLMTSRLFRRQKGEPKGILSGEFHVPETIDRFLESVLDVERVLMRAGIRFPMGGSQLAVARKPTQ